MPKVLPALFSYEDMKKRFAQDNPDDPYTRRADLESGIYELDKWLIRVDDEDKAISTVGFKEHPSHTVVGGMYATAKGREIGGNNRALQDAREPQLNQSKPLVAAFGHRFGDNARWIANAKRNGWSFPDSENWEQMSSLLPQDVLNAWISRYPENMGIRSIRGEGEFAKCVYLDDYSDFNLLKMETGWFSILKKRKFNFQVMKEAVKNVVSDLNGESIEGMRLRQKIADEYKLLISKTGNKADIDSANRRLKDLESIKPFLKLMRNYGYNSRTVGGGPIGQVGLFNPVMDDTIWEK
tara:strand:- start:755 stop:1642 length:888 start_codon:yes stop_codon:yes gene_type:complete